MKEKKTATATKEEFDHLEDLVIDAIQDIKGKNIVKLDLRGLTDANTDQYIVCEGESITQVIAIASNIKRRVRNEWGLHAGTLEGESEGKWVLIDYFDLVIHVFYPETRTFYNIEDLWSDAKITEYDNI